MDLHAFLFWTVAVLTGLSALMVVVTQNIVRAAAWLLFALAGTAGLFFLLGADFVGATQLIVYVGGTLVLVVFGVMLTAQEGFISMKTSAAEWAVATVVGLVFLAVLIVSIFTDVSPAPLQAKHLRTTAASTVGMLTTPAGQAPLTAAAALYPGRIPDTEIRPDQSLSSVALGESLLGVKEATPQAQLTGVPERSGAASAAERTRMSYLFPFEIVSVHLLVVLIGAAFLARARRRRGAAS